MRGVRSFDATIYVRAFALLVRHPQIMLAPLGAALLQTVLFLVMPVGDGIMTSINGGLASLFSQLIWSFGLAVAIIVADSAWRYGSAPFDSAWEQARNKGGDIIMAVLGLSFVTYVAGLIGSAFPFGSLALSLVAIFFLVYALPATAIGGIPGMASLQISIERARAAIGPTLVATALFVFAFAIAPSLIVALLTPLLLSNTALASGAVSSIVVAFVKAPIAGYVALVLARTYDLVSYGRLR